MTGPKIAIVVGLPGSRKSTYSMGLADAGGISGRSIHDDDFLRGDLRPPHGFEGVIGRLKDGEGCVVNDIALCDELRRIGVRERIESEVPGVVIEWHYLDNDPLQCAANVILDAIARKRNDMMNRLDAIRKFSPMYRPPAGVVVRPVPGAIFGPRPF